MGGKLAHTTIWLMFYRMTLFVNVFARGGWLEPENPVNQAVIRRLPQSTYLKSCVTLHWLTCFVFIFHLISWSFTCIAFKFCCTLSHAVLNGNKDRTITVSVSRSKLIQGGSEPSQIAIGCTFFEHSRNQIRTKSWSESEIEIDRNCIPTSTDPKRHLP